MHLKAVFSLLMLSCLFLRSNCFIQNYYYVTDHANLYSTVRAASLTVGSSSLFALTSANEFYGFNSDTKTTFVNDDMYTAFLSYAVVGDVAYLSSQSTIASPIFAFNSVTGQTLELPGSRVVVSYRSLSSVGQNVYIAGGQTYDEPSDSLVEVNTLGIYNTVTNTTSDVTLPFSRRSLTSVPVGNYILFAGGMLGSDPKSDVAIFDVNARTFTTATMTMNNNTQGVSIGRFAILINGNVADVFDSTSKTWTTHTLSQSAPQFGFQYQFSIAKTQRYVFIVAAGRADVFDSTSQTWSTINFAAPMGSYCPSTAVNDYALFSSGNLVHIFDTSILEFIGTFTLVSPYQNSLFVIGAGVTGDIAIFLAYELGIKMTMYTMDFSSGGPISANLTPQVVSPVQVPATLSTHQLAETTSQYAVAGNDIVFMNDQNTNVEIYNSQTDSWTTSTPSANTRGGLLASANSYLVFTDTASGSLFNVLSLASNSWTAVTKHANASELWLTVGDYLFFAERVPIWETSTYLEGPIAYSLKDDTWTSLGWSGYSLFSLGSIRYKDYAVFADVNSRFYSAEAYNTADNLARALFDYSGEARIQPNIATPGDYLVIAGGYLDNGFSDDYSIRNLYTGVSMSGKMPTPHPRVSIFYVNPYMVFIAGDRMELLNMETKLWNIGSLSVSLDNTLTSGHKLFTSNNTRDYLAAFDSQTNHWYNITFNPAMPVGQFVKFGDMAAFWNSNSVVIYNPYNDKWTQSTFSGKQFKTVMNVGNRVVFVSADDSTIDTIALATLTTLPTAPVPSPSTPVTQTPTATNPPTTQTQPWSPWMYTPTASNPVPTSTPVSTATPSGSSPLSQSPSSIEVPVSSNTPVASNQPSTTTTPAVSVVPLNSDNNVQVSSASLLVVVQSLAVCVVAILLF